MNAVNLPIWLSEDVTWPVLWGILAIGIFGFAWFMTQKWTPLILAMLSGLLLIGVVLLEIQTVTDKEYLEDAVYRMADAVRNNDADGVATFISEDMPELRQTLYSEKQNFHVDSCQVIGFRPTELLPNRESATTANVGFSVWGSGSYVARNLSYTGAIRVDLKFKKVDGQWGIVQYSYAPANAPQ